MADRSGTPPREMTDNKPSNLTCKICCKSFNFSGNMKKHMTLHSRSWAPLNTRRVFACGTCDRKFVNNANLSRHQLVQHAAAADAIDDFPCKHCDLTFEDIRQLKIHVQSEHKAKKRASRSDNPSKDCPVCGKHFNRPSDVGKHIVTHYNVFPFECDMCDKKFKRKVYLSTHKREVHDGEKSKNVVCPVCGKTFNRRCQLREHIVTHSSVFPFQCDMCHKKFKLEIYLSTHKRQVHDGEESTEPALFECQICNKCFELEKSLARHMTSHSQNIPSLECDICNKKFKCRRNLTQHQLVVHEAPAGRAVFPCKHCEQTFFKVWDRAHHVEEQHRRTKFIGPEFRWACPESNCERSYILQSTLKNHIKEVHTEKRQLTATERKIAKAKKNAQIVQCSECQKKMRADFLRRHTATVHHGVKLFTSKICGRSFSHRKTLKLHNEIHLQKGICKPPRVLRSVDPTIIIPKSHISPSDININDVLDLTRKEKFGVYACKTCGKEFKNIHGLKRHQLTHMELEPVKCPICSKELANETNVRLHIRSVHHQRKNHKSKFCDLTFRFKHGRDAHDKIHSESGKCVAFEDSKNKFKCSSCSLAFPLLSLLRSHAYIAHNEHTTFKSKFCDLTFLCRSTRNKHDKFHSKNGKCVKSKFKCPSCSLTFSLKGLLRSHASIAHNERRTLKSKFCDLTFKGWRTRNRHDKFHSSEGRCVNLRTHSGKQTRTQAFKQIGRIKKSLLSKLAQNEDRNLRSSNIRLEVENPYDEVRIQLDRMEQTNAGDDGILTLKSSKDAWYVCGTCGRANQVRDIIRIHQQNNCVNTEIKIEEEDCFYGMNSPEAEPFEEYESGALRSEKSETAITIEEPAGFAIKEEMEEFEECTVASETNHTEHQEEEVPMGSCVTGLRPGLTNDEQDPLDLESSMRNVKSPQRKGKGAIGWANKFIRKLSELSFECKICGCKCGLNRTVRGHIQLSHPEIYKSHRYEPDMNLEENRRRQEIIATIEGHPRPTASKQEIAASIEGNPRPTASKQEIAASIEGNPRPTAFKCKLCGKIYHVKKSLATHVNRFHEKSLAGSYIEEVHGAEVPAPGFNTVELNGHKIVLNGWAKEFMEIVEGDRPFQCKLCTENFEKRNALAYHIRKHPEAVCGNCHTVHKWDYGIHAETNSKCYMFVPGKPGALDTVKRKKLFKCKQCGRKFRILRLAQLHVSKSHGMKASETIESFITSQVDTLIVGGTEIQLKGWTRKYMEIIEGDRPFKCRLCGKDFQKRVLLQNHM